MPWPCVLDIVVRTECAGDIDAISALTKDAFFDKPYSGGDEQDIIHALRRHGVLTLSLVATHADVLLGHVAFSPASVPDGSTGWFALGPIAVEPTRQRQGIGSILVRAGLEQLRAAGAVGCIVIGDVNYYPRFGFIPRPDLAPNGQPAEHFMVLAFTEKVPDAVVSFHDIFETFG